MHLAEIRKVQYNLWLLVLVLTISSGFVFLLITRSFETYSYATASVEKSISELKSAITLGERRTEPLVLPILVYHYVENVTDKRDTIRQSLSISPQVFESQILTLLTRGYEPVTISQISDYFIGRTELPEKPVVLSFDDGYHDFYTDVFPILVRYHVPAVLYLTSGSLDSTQNYLTTDQILEISQKKLVEINSHSITHPDLRLIPLDQVRFEIRNGKVVLEKLIGRSVEHFAYPFGKYTPELIHEVEKAGFKTAATTDFGTLQSYQDRYELKRIRPGNLTGQALLEYLQRR